MKISLRLLLLALLPTTVATAAEVASLPVSTSKNLLAPTTDLRHWQLEVIQDASGKIGVDKDAIMVTITKVDGTDWHVQAYQVGLELKEGKEYIVTVDLRASTKCTAQLYAGVNEENYHALGLDEPLVITPEWRTLTFTFKVESAPAKNNRIGFLLGDAVGTIWIRNFVLTAK